MLRYIQESCRELLFDVEDVLNFLRRANDFVRIEVFALDNLSGIPIQKSLLIVECLALFGDT